MPSMPTAKPQPLAQRHVLVSRSTNSDVMLALQSGAIDSRQPYLLTATSQTAGRGQHGRSWQSPAGNVYLSLYQPLRTPLSGLLSLHVGYQLTQLPILQHLNRQRTHHNLPRIGVKWVNDIGFYDMANSAHPSNDSTSNNPINDLSNQATGQIKPRQQFKQSKQLRFNKLAGILIEPVWVHNRMVGVVVGVGLNVAQAPLLTTTTQELTTTTQDGLNHCAVSLQHLLAMFSAQSVSAAPTSTTPSADTAATAPLSATLQPADLYLPISSAIGRAITQFEHSYDNAYQTHQFVEDFAKVDVLAQQRLRVHRTFQHIGQSSDKKSSAADVEQSSQPIDKGQQRHETDDAITDILIGRSLGIDLDGGLLFQPDDADAPLTLYTGTIAVLGN